MPTVKSMRRVAALTVGAASIAATVAVVSASSAEATMFPAPDGYLCTTLHASFVREAPSSESHSLYPLASGRGFRLVHYNANHSWVYGHAQGHANGWIPDGALALPC